MTAMKKNITFGMIGALALVSLASCNQKLLDIPQKGVVAYEDFYHTDEDAQSALTAVYHEFINLVNDQARRATSSIGAAARRTAQAPVPRI